MMIRKIIHMIGRFYGERDLRNNNKHDNIVIHIVYFFHLPSFITSFFLVKSLHFAHQGKKNRRGWHNLDINMLH